MDEFFLDEVDDKASVQQEPTPTWRKHFDNRDELCRHMRERTGSHVILAFSLGKDSIAAYLTLRDYFEHVHLYYRYATWPILGFTEDKIKYFEDRWQLRIWRLPDRHFFRKIVEAHYMPPHMRRIGAIAFPNRALWESQDFVLDRLRDFLDAKGAYEAVGIRRNDSLVRRASITRTGPISHDRRRFFPIFDMDKKELMDLIRREGVTLPVDYRMFGKTCDGLDYQYIAPIKRHFPDDYQILLGNYPLLEAEIKRKRFIDARRIPSARG